MKYTTLPNTTIEVSKICLGTMTFGEQNTEKEAHEMMNCAFEMGINFLDTAEMYSVPGRKETQGNSERIIGSWIANQQREKVIVATKVTGPSIGLAYIRKNMNFSNSSIDDAIEKSLKRLRTDYIDLYQLHWPERNTNFFGKRNYKHDFNEEWKDNFAAVIDKLNALKNAGKIRSYGVSNETPWGLMRHLEVSKNKELIRCSTIQNPYSLLNRTFEIGLAEMAIREEVGLMAYSPMAFGSLSGKYLNGNFPEGSRLKRFPNFSRYNSETAQVLVEKYSDLAKELNISPAQLALAFVNHQPFLSANIIGATNLHQLKENIGSISIELSEETLKRVDEIQEIQPNPAP